MARRERLAPWLDALRIHTRLAPRPTRHTVGCALETGVVWLDWKLVTAPGNGHAPEPLLSYEALQLLALLARIDYNEWIGALSLLWPHTTRFWANVFYPDKFELGINVRIANGGQLGKWAERGWLANPALANVGDDYSVVRDDFEATLCGISGGRHPSPEIQVRIRLVDSFGDQVPHISLILFESAQFARTQAARAATSAMPRRWQPLFRLVEVQVSDLHSDLPLKDILCVEEITSCCVGVEVFSLGSGSNLVT